MLSASLNAGTAVARRTRVISFSSSKAGAEASPVLVLSFSPRGQNQQNRPVLNGAASQPETLSTGSA